MTHFVQKMSSDNSIIINSFIINTLDTVHSVLQNCIQLIPKLNLYKLSLGDG